MKNAPLPDSDQESNPPPNPPAKDLAERTLKDPLKEWARFVDQDSQAKSIEYLEQSRAEHSGE